MGQLTHNMVARNIRLFAVTPYGDLSTGQLAANNMEQPVREQNGVRPLYAWGMYNYCGGSRDFEQMQCGPRSFGHTFDVVDAVSTDVPRGNSASSVPFSSLNQDSIKNYSRAAFYLLFVGTVLTGVAFIVALLFHPAALSLAAFLTFLAFALLTCGASIDTYFINKMKYHTPNIQDNVFHFGNALWMFWAAVGSTLVAFPCLLGGATGGHETSAY